MTTYDYGTPPGSEAGGTKDQAKEAAGTAKEEGRHVAEVTKGEAQQVASEAKAHASNLLDEARTQVEAQSRSQLDRLVGALQSFSDDLERMVRGEGPSSDTARDVVTQVSERAKSFSSQLQGREPAELLEEVRSFARRRPGTFLLGALAAGVVAGRLTRGAKDAHSGAAGQATPTDATGRVDLPSSGQGLTTPAPGVGTAADTPLAGTTPPQGDPVYPEGTPTSSTAWGNPETDPASAQAAPGTDPTRGMP